MRTDVIWSESKLDARRVILWLGAMVLGGWLAWCAIFQFLGVSTEAEVIQTYVEHRGWWRKGGRDSYTYGDVRYVDTEGRTHTKRLQLSGETSVGRKIPVRYLTYQPDDCRRDSFWGIWGLSVLVTAVLVVSYRLPRLSKRWRVRRAMRPKPSYQPST